MNNLRLFPIFGVVICVTVVILFSHLNVYLKGSTSNYQDDTMDWSSPSTIYRDYVRYVTNIDTTCQKKRQFGGPGDSGYDVCVDDLHIPQQPCLVYSFGSGFDFGFENDVIKDFGCEIHTFDPSLPIAGHHIPEGINFHLIGLSDRDYTNELGWPIRSLQSFREALNHTFRNIDLLKVDIEGYEWRAIPHILSTVPIKYIKQLLIEIHFGREKAGMGDGGFITLKSNYWGNVDIYTQFGVLKQLYNYGFRVFSYLENPRSRIKVMDPELSGVISCYVVSMININNDL